MRQESRTVALGELVAAAFDQAGLQTKRPGDISRLAAASIDRLLVRAQRTAPPRRYVSSTLRDTRLRMAARPKGW